MRLPIVIQICIFFIYLAGTQCNKQKKHQSVDEYDASDQDNYKTPSYKEPRFSKEQSSEVCEREDFIKEGNNNIKTHSTILQQQTRLFNHNPLPFRSLCCSS